MGLGGGIQTHGQSFKKKTAPPRLSGRPLGGNRYHFERHFETSLVSNIYIYGKKEELHVSENQSLSIDVLSGKYKRL